MIAWSVMASARTGAVLSHPQTTVYTVHEGDTLWSIAERFAPRYDPRAVIDWIYAHGVAEDKPLQPGQTIVVPVGR